ncbi:MAG: MocE family 2Fe-2S type ferredoxin [Betaproteobacteria bacterium]|jgi:3-phenylpropionate/trans-cinnamate dioxygenase ferredoxin subunit
MGWVLACSQDDIDQEDLITIDLEGVRVAIYRSEDDEFFATAGICTHEAVDLGDGLVMGDVIECPKHNGRFNYKTGEGLTAPICQNLKTYNVKLDGDDVLVEL